LSICKKKKEKIGCLAHSIQKWWSSSLGDRHGVKKEGFFEDLEKSSDHAGAEEDVKVLIPTPSAG